MTQDEDFETVERFLRRDTKVGALAYAAEREAQAALSRIRSTIESKDAEIERLKRSAEGWESTALLAETNNSDRKAELGHAAETLAELVAERDTLQAEVERLRGALELIADPEQFDADWRAMRRVADGALKETEKEPALEDVTWTASGGSKIVGGGV